MSYIVFKGDGSVYKDWVSPILVNGIINNGGDPIDLTDLATRTWVTDQIRNAIKNGTLDLSTYATKSYVDQKISEIPGGGGSTCLFMYRLKRSLVSFSWMWNLQWKKACLLSLVLPDAEKA